MSQLFSETDVGSTARVQLGGELAHDCSTVGSGRPYQEVPSADANRSRDS